MRILVSCSVILLALAGAAAAGGGRGPLVWNASPDGDRLRASFPVAGGAIDITLAPTNTAVPREAIERWVERAADALTAFYARFPQRRLRLEISTTGRRRVSGTTYGGRRIRVTMGAASGAGDLDRDWVLTHEFFHTAFPDLDDRHRWMEEGLATYFEPIARARVGQVAEERVWSDLLDGLPKGLPQAGDEGLDRTPTWGRTYWGGALFWLLADVAIREETGGRRAADDVLRACLDAGGDGSRHWSMARVIETGDRATGTRVLADLYARLAERREDVDLDDIFRRLGVARAGRGVAFDERAPLAAIRRAITSPEADLLR
jgi:hypothetical protein